jgi:hypothetical protein
MARLEETICWSLGQLVREKTDGQRRRAIQEVYGKKDKGQCVIKTDKLIVQRVKREDNDMDVRYAGAKVYQCIASLYTLQHSNERKLGPLVDSSTTTRQPAVNWTLKTEDHD